MCPAYVTTNQNCLEEQNILFFNYSLLHPPLNCWFFAQIQHISTNYIFKLNNLYLFKNTDLKSFSNEIIKIESLNNQQILSLLPISQNIKPLQYGSTATLNLNLNKQIASAELTCKSHYKSSEMLFAPFTKAEIESIYLKLSDTADH